MGEFSDTSFEQLPLAAKRRIDAVCERFEEAWRGGQARLESFLAEVPEDERLILVGELLHIEVEFRRRAGQSPQAADYLSRLPGYEALIRQVLPPAEERPTRLDPLGLPDGGTVSPSGAAASGPRMVPGYEVLEELGKGGMGVVYKARHLALNRLVALKFIRGGGSAGARHQERFRREAEVVARLRHPNIIQIYDIGEAGGQCFLALEYAEGGSLRQRLAGAPMQARAAVVLLEPLARAVQHAHRQGVIHRDLKPANILMAAGGDSISAAGRTTAGPPAEWRPPVDLPDGVDLMPPLASCTPKLTDFGLAMLVQDGTGGEPHLAAGTPSYMSPEQVVNGEVGPASDIWALGATLYELLTGRPPFQGATITETFRLILQDDPLPPSRLQPSVPRALDTVCLKCLQKEPAQRYGSARELAQDLRRFLTGEPILARPVGSMQRARRWARRRPALAALVGVVLLGLFAAVAGLGGALLYALAGWRQAEREADLVRAAAGAAEQRHESALHKSAADRRAARQQSAELLLDRAARLGEAGRIDQALHALVAALRAAPESDDELRRVLRVNLAAWGRHAHRLERIIPADGAVSCLAVSPDGRTLWLGSGTRTTSIDLETGKAGGPPLEHEQAPAWIAFGPNGSRALIGQGQKEAWLWDVLSGKRIGSGLAHAARVNHAVFAPDGKHLFTACADGTVQRWDEHGKPAGGALRHPLPARGLALAPDGRTLAVALGEQGGQRGAVWLWDLAVTDGAPRVLPHPAGVNAIVFHPDGRGLFSAAADGRVRAWDGKRGTPLGPALVHPTAVVGLDIAPDGRALLAATADGKARLWDRASGACVGVLAGAGGRACLSPDGRRAAVAAGAEVRLYSLARPLSRPAGESRTRPVLPAGPGQVVAYLDAGRRVLTIESIPGRAHGLARLHDARTGRPVSLPWPHAAAQVEGLAVSADGLLAATVCGQPGKGSTIHLWQATTGKPLARVTAASRVRCLAFDAAGKRLAAGDDSGAVWLYEVPSGRQDRQVIKLDQAVLAVALAPSGGRLAAGTTGAVRLLDLDGEDRPRMLEHPGPVTSLTFDRAGAALLIGGDRARLWDLERRQPRSRLLPDVSAVQDVAGRLGLVGSKDGAVRQYDLARGEIIIPTIIAPAEVLAAALSPDGRYLLAGLADGSARLWDLSGTGRRLGPAVVHGSPVRGVFFEPDGKWFLTTGSDGTTRRWPVPAAWEETATEALARRAEALTGQIVDGTGELTLLPAGEWDRRRAGLVVAGASAAEWHDARARDAEADGDLFAARRHLDLLLKLRPGDRGLLARRGLVHARAGDFARAAADLDRAGEEGAMRNALATCQAVGAWKAALWCLERVASSPEDAGLAAEEREACRMLGEEPGGD